MKVTCTMHAWIDQMLEQKIKIHHFARHDSEINKEIRMKFDHVVDNVLDLVRKYFKDHHPIEPTIHIHVRCHQQESDDNMLICDFKIVPPTPNVGEDHQAKYYRCMSHIPKACMNHVFTPGMIWVSMQLDRPIELIFNFNS